MTQAPANLPREHLLELWWLLEPERCRSIQGNLRVLVSSRWFVLDTHPEVLQLAVEQAVVERGWRLLHYYDKGRAHRWIVEFPCGSGYQVFLTEGDQPDATLLQAYLAAVEAFQKFQSSLS
ncbi:MAG TPA: hypothetical protein V6D06_14870 [Trichocoleus sp.]